LSLFLTRLCTVAWRSRAKDPRGFFAQQMDSSQRYDSMLDRLIRLLPSRRLGRRKRAKNRSITVGSGRFIRFRLSLLCAAREKRVGAYWRVPLPHLELSGQRDQPDRPGQQDHVSAFEVHLGQRGCELACLFGLDGLAFGCNVGGLRLPSGLMRLREQRQPSAQRSLDLDPLPFENDRGVVKTPSALCVWLP
jgi:hypothetical protein